MGTQLRSILLLASLGYRQHFLQRLVCDEVLKGPVLEDGIPTAAIRLGGLAWSGQDRSIIFARTYLGARAAGSEWI
jgi:hypothetical protein